jgi:hypothetical protein
MNLYLCSPASAQGRTIARLVNSYCPNICIIGLLLPGENPFYCKKISRFEYVNKLELSLISGRILPTGAESTKFFLERGDVFFGNILLKKDALKVFDKPWIIKQAEFSKVPVPQTWTEIEQIEKYPVFFKQRYEKGGGDRGVAYNYRDIPANGFESLMFQEYIDSPGTYGVSFIARNGKIIAVHTHYERESNPPAGGSAVFIENFHDTRLETYTANLLSQLNYSGWGLAEFKYCPKRNDYVFMEINAKFWASCALAFANEPTFAKLLFNIDKPNEKIHRILYMNRALRRGPCFLLKNIYYIKNSQFVLFPGILSSFIIGVLPLFMINMLRNIKNLLSTLYKNPVC